jgi:hypothetical protein
MSMNPGDYVVSSSERAALKRLLTTATGAEGEPVANFLLAWWNPKTCGGLAISELWGVNAQTTSDLTAVFSLAIRSMMRPDSLGYEAEFAALIAQRRPNLRTS